MKSFKQHLAEETAEDIIKMVPGGKDAEAVYNLINEKKPDFIFHLANE